MQKQRFHLIPFGSILLLFAVFGCTAPRSVTLSGKVTAPKQFKVGMNWGFNAASEPLGYLDDITGAAVEAVTEGTDKVYFDQQIDKFAAAITSYIVDPVGPAYDLYIRYGIAPKFDIGYKYASGAHVVDGMYQFMGSTGTPDNPGEDGIYGSVGLQFSSQGYNFGDQFYLQKINNLLSLSASRKDIVIPLIFSKSFGPEEEIGSIAWGVVYNHAFIKYGFEPGAIFKRINNEDVKIQGVQQQKNFPAFGAFVNARIGYKFIYLVPAFTVYYQNYGTFELLEGRQYSYKGMTFIPSLGIQARFGANKGNR